MRLSWVRPINMIQAWVDVGDEHDGLMLTWIPTYGWDEEYPIYTPYLINARDLYFIGKSFSGIPWQSVIIKELDFNRRLICVRTDYPFSFLMVWYWSLLLKLEESWNEVIQKALSMLLTIWFPGRVRFECNEMLDLGSALKKLTEKKKIKEQE